jgi:hypothetical protein
MMSKQQAREIAEAYLTRDDVPADWQGIRDVVTLRELAPRHKAASPFWFLTKIDPSKCWIAYVQRAGPPMIRSSTVVLIDQETGAVLYAGSACDEG